MSDKKTTLEMLKESEEFFKNAFCAKSAKLLKSIDGFEIAGVVEIDTGDKRGIIFVGSLKKIDNTPPIKEE